ncbi:MAG TPA: hypothetical protein VHH53_12430, partial [Pseudonocardiaceae bacterium]|nr:hypothetical protein [Pseudonocardiaceae bacterium]
MLWAISSAAETPAAVRELASVRVCFQRVVEVRWAVADAVAQEVQQRRAAAGQPRVDRDFR